MVLNTEQYNSLNEKDKVTFFDNVDLVIKDINWTKQETKKSFKELLFFAFNDVEEDVYVRKRALETICNLTFSNVFRKGGTSDLLLDVSIEDDSFILNVAIKNLFYLHETEEFETIQKLKKLCSHSDGDVSSEAYFRLGQIYFFKSNENDYNENILKAHEYFFKSNQEIENRKDAELFLLISEILTGKNKRESILSEISNVLWQLTSFDFNDKVDSIYFKIFNVLVILQKLTKNNPNQFFEEEFNQLCTYHYELLNCKLNGGIKNTFLDIFKLNVKLNHIEPFYYLNLKGELSRVKRLLNDSRSDEERLFWKYLISLFNDDLIKKKDNTDIPFLLARLLPSIPIANLKKEIASIDHSDPIELLNYILPHIERKGNELITGSNIGDDIFKDISSELKQKCGTSYPHKRFLEFQLVLKDVIKYMVRASEAQRSDPNFNFLFNKDALENDLQRSMINMFKLASKRGESYSEENQEFTDGGRIDIKYQSNEIIIPLELKRTKVLINLDRIKNDYLSQAQTYTYNHDRLGFFILLDLVEKDKAKPSNDLRDLFGIIHLETQHRVNEKHPDYIVWCIVPANKLLPSNRSKYV